MAQAKEIQITGPVTRVLAELDRSAAEDVANVCRRSRAGWGIAGSILLLIVSFVTMAASRPTGMVLAGLSGVALIICIVLYTQYNRRDFEDRKRNVARQFFAVLAQDIPRKAHCRIWLNDDGYLKHGQVSDQTGGVFSSVHTASYEDPWGLLAGRLHDGTAFKVKITQLVKRKSKSKRKYIKIQERHQEKVSLILRLNPTNYPGLAQLPAQLQGSTLDSMSITRAELAGTILRVTAITGMVPRFHGRSGWSEFNVQELVTGPKLLDLFVAIYSQLDSTRGDRVQHS